MRFHRGLALILLLFGGLYLGVGQLVSVGKGPADTSFEALRRYDAAMRQQQGERAAQLGETVLSMAQKDERWSAPQIAQLEMQLAGTYRNAGDDYRALELMRRASERVLYAPDAGLTSLIDIARARADQALALSRPLEAACTWGLVLERVGPDRVANPQLRARPHPELEWLSLHLINEGARITALETAGESDTEPMPLATCQLLANFYADREDFDAAAAVSDLIVSSARQEGAVGAAIRAALLRNAADIHERRGDIFVAEARLREAIEVVETTNNTQALLVALDNLSSFLSTWGDAERALPILERSISIRESLKGSLHPDLVTPLMALGYARRDLDDKDGARAAFEDALAIARSDYGSNSPAALEILLALSEIALEQGRLGDAKSLTQQARKLEREGVVARPEVGIDYGAIPAAEHSVIVLSVPFAATGRPAGGRAAEAFGPPATDLHLGRVEVAVGLSGTAPWADLWPAYYFEAASDFFSSPLVYAPELRDWNLEKANTTTVFVPGQSSSFASAAGRAARLQAVLGPNFTVLLADWPKSATMRGYMRDARQESLAEDHLSRVLLALIERDGDGPIQLVAEGRGAHLLDAALKGLRQADAERLLARLDRIALLNPDISASVLKDWAERAKSAHKPLVNYGTRGVEALLVASEVYGSEALGLEPARMAELSLSETVIIPAPVGASFDTVMSDALAQDLATVLRDGLDASNRCGLAAEDGAGLLWRLENQGEICGAGGPSASAATN